MKFILLTSLIVIFSTSSAVLADYDITLKNGKVITTSKCWERGKQVDFYWEGGIVGVPKANILSIKINHSPAKQKSAYHKSSINEPGTELGKKGNNISERKDDKFQSQGKLEYEDQKLNPREKYDLKNRQLYEKQKAFLIEKYQEAYERYLEASSRNDKGAKIKAWEEFNDFGGQAKILEEKIKKMEKEGK